MDKETLSNYGWVVICVIVLSVMIALATPFATAIKDAVVATVNNLITKADASLDAISGNETAFDGFVSITNS